MAKKKVVSHHAVLQRLSDLEGKLDQVLADLEEIKISRGKGRRRRLSLFAKPNRDRSEDPPSDTDLILDHPMLQSMLQNNSKGAMNLIQGIDPDQISKALKNPFVQSILKKMA